MQIKNQISLTRKTLYALMLLGLFFSVFGAWNLPSASAQESTDSPVLKPTLSADGLTAYNAVPLLAMVVDPNPNMQGIKIPDADKGVTANVASATFDITYVAAGGTDLDGQTCTTFPESAKAAFNEAAAIWSSKIQSAVPITIKACWASLSSSGTLGYSGGGTIHRNFSGAPLANTWYGSSLANSIAGSDLAPASFDMQITYNSNFPWYYGTDSNPPIGQYDLVTVAAHEIAHGLNFSGSASYDEGTYTYGYLGSPYVYDTFIKDGSGNALTSYPSGSTALGSLLTSSDLWFHGTQAMAGNGGARVKMYAPPSWKPGSSYSHLDYETFKAPNINSMMIFSIGSGSANHNPGPVTSGLLQDLGWSPAIIPWVGSVSITADKNVVAVGRPHIGENEIASYSGFSAGAMTAYVPMLFNGAWGNTYNSALYVQNVDTLVDANVSIKYYNSETGALTCTTTDTIKPLASRGYWLPDLSATPCLPSGLPVGWVGSAVVTSSTANIVAIGRPHIGNEVMTYDSFSSGSLTSYLPMLFNGAWGSYNSAYYVQNVDPLINAEVTIKYYNSDTGALTCTDTATIAPNTSKGYWLPTAKCLYSTSTTPDFLPAGWVGGVVITSSAAPIVSVGRPHVVSQITTYNGFAAGGLSSYVPMLFRKAYDGTYDSALYVQNVGAVDAAITIKYYKIDGTLTCTATDTIKSLSSKGYWLPYLSAAQCTGGTGSGLPDGWIGGAVVTSSTANIVAIGRPHIGAQVTTYNGFTSGNSDFYLPMLFKNKWGYDSAFYIQNTDAVGPAAVTVKFYDTDGNLSCVRHDNILALSTLGYWVPTVACE